MGINKQKYFNYVCEFFNKYECELLTTFDNFTNRIDNNLTFKCKCGEIEEYINFKWYSRSVYKLSRRNEEFNNFILLD